MSYAVSDYPDKTLRFIHSLPRPANYLSFRLLRRFLRGRGNATGALTRIRFGTVEIAAPLDHPAVYWRYWPRGFNQNYVFVVKRLLEARTGLIIDVGANIGDGVALIRGEGLIAPILAIEGANVWFDLLKSNTSGMRDINLEHVFLGTGEEDNEFGLRVQYGTSQLVKGDSGVELVSLDSLLIRHIKHPVILLKTDTDGFDAKVLFGAKHLLTEQKPVVFAEIDEGLLRNQGNDSRELTEYFLKCGYEKIAVWDNLGRWLTSRPLSDGIADLVKRYPGGPEGHPYLDVAVLSAIDRNLLD